MLNPECTQTDSLPQCEYMDMDLKVWWVTESDKLRFKLTQLVLIERSAATVGLRLLADMCNFACNLMLTICTQHLVRGCKHALARHGNSHSMWCLEVSTLIIFSSFQLASYSLGVEPDVAHQTSLTESTGVSYWYLIITDKMHPNGSIASSADWSAKARKTRSVKPKSCSTNWYQKGRAMVNASMIPFINKRWTTAQTHAQANLCFILMWVPWPLAYRISQWYLVKRLANQPSVVL